jgi:sugar O-acyltransferase (sialic acid O-acetyltransferase NeuD family)
MKDTQARLLVWGAGGHAKVVADLILALGMELCGFVTNDPDLVSAAVEPFKARIVMLETDLLRGRILPRGASAVAPGFGANAARLSGAIALGERCAGALIHPDAVIGSDIQLGRGSVVFSGAVVSCGTRIGLAVIVNTAAVLQDGCIVEDGAHVSPGAVVLGNAEIGAMSWVGANATVLQNVRIGSGAIVGAGSVVRESVPDSATVVGNPARIVRRGAV